MRQDYTFKNCFPRRPPQEPIEQWKFVTFLDGRPLRACIGPQGNVLLPRNVVGGGVRDLVHLQWYLYSLAPSGGWVHDTDLDGDNTGTAVRHAVERVRSKRPDGAGIAGVSVGPRGWVYVSPQTDELGSQPALPDPVWLYYQWSTPLFRAPEMLVWQYDNERKAYVRV